MQIKAPLMAVAGPALWLRSDKADIYIGVWRVEYCAASATDDGAPALLFGVLKRLQTLIPLKTAGNLFRLSMVLRINAEVHCYFFFFSMASDHLWLPSQTQDKYKQTTVIWCLKEELLKPD